MTDGARKIDLDATLRTFIEHMDQINASELYLTAESPPVFRVDDVTYPGRVPLSAAEIEGMAESVMSAAQRQEFRVVLEMNTTLKLRDDAFCRINLFRQRGTLGIVVRLVRTRAKALEELGYPGLLQKIASSRSGLVLVVGSRGSGRSTTLAALVDYRNSTQGGHILTIEDPIEVHHQHKKSIVTQREVGIDTRSFAAGLNSAMRQTPDVVLVGEVRDAEVMEAVLSLAGSGHLCLSTLHANTAKQAVDRILGFFPVLRHAEIRMRLAHSLRAVIAQRLVPTLQGTRIGALEILLNTDHIQRLIQRGELDALHDAMSKDAVEGCCTLDASLFALFCTGQISEATAMQAAEDPGSLRTCIENLRERQLAATVQLRLAAEPLALPESAGGASVPERRSKVASIR
jgi:twitching motility protein PilU